MGEIVGERRTLEGDAWGNVVNGMGEGFLALSVFFWRIVSSCSSSSEEAYINPSTIPSWLSILSCAQCTTRPNTALNAASSLSSLPRLHLRYLSLCQISSSLSSSSSEESIPLARSCNRKTNPNLSVSWWTLVVRRWWEWCERSEMCLEWRLKEAGGCCGWCSLSEASRWKRMNTVKRKKRESTTAEEGNMARSGMHPQEAMWVSAYWSWVAKYSIREKSLHFRAKLERCRRVRSVFVGWKDFVCWVRIVGRWGGSGRRFGTGSRSWWGWLDDHRECHSARAGINLRFGVEWESHECMGW